MHIDLPIVRAALPLLGPACAHGLADVRFRLDTLATYALLAAPVPEPASLCAFAIASVVHFADDVGWTTSFALHGVLGLMALRGMLESAVVLLLLYMNLVHFPALLHRIAVDERRRSAAWQVALVCGIAAVLVPSLFHATTHDEVLIFTLTPAMQRLVALHVLVVSRERARDDLEA